MYFLAIDTPGASYDCSILLPRPAQISRRTNLHKVCQQKAHSPITRVVTVVCSNGLA